MSDQNFDFSSTEEQESTGNQYLNPGIHVVKIESVEYEKAGYGESMIITLQDPDSGASLPNQKWFNPYNKVEGADVKKKVENFMSRILHLFSKVSGSDKVEELKTNIKAIKAKSFEDLVNILKGMGEGKTVRMKLIADPNNRQYTKIPHYLGGFVECIDSNSSMTFSEEREGRIAVSPDAETTGGPPSSAPTPEAGSEKKTEAEAVDAATNSAGGDDLPF